MFCIDLTARQKRYFFIFHFLIFDDFVTAFAKNLMKRPPVFMSHIKRLYKLLLSHKGLESANFGQWNDGLLNVFKNVYRNAFSLFVLIKRKNHCKASFNDIYIKCFGVICFNESWSSLKRRFWNNGPSNMLCHYFRSFTFSYLYSNLAEIFMIKLSVFNINFWNLFYDVLFCPILRYQTCYY